MLTLYNWGMSTDPLSRNKIRVGILRGGPSTLYDVSLRTGAEILKHLPDRYTPVDILVSREGQWHIGGKVVSPAKVFQYVDVVWNALHGQYGEDGKAQQTLEMFGIPYTGSKPLSSALGMNKNLSKALFAYHGFKTPQHTIVHPRDNTLSNLVSLFQSVTHPSIIKPVSHGSSLGVTYADSFDSFKKGIEDVLKIDHAAIVEEYIPGIEVMCGVMERPNSRDLFSFEPVIPDKQTSGVYTFAAKHGHDGGKTLPHTLSKEEVEAVQQIAKAVHAECHLRHYSSSDIIIHPTRGMYVLEVNSQPSLTDTSLFPKALKTANISMEEFIDEVVELALSHTQS